MARLAGDAETRRSHRIEPQGGLHGGRAPWAGAVTGGFKATQGHHSNSTATVRTWDLWPPSLAASGLGRG